VAGLQAGGGFAAGGPLPSCFRCAPLEALMEHLILQAGKALAAVGDVKAGLSMARKEVATAPLDTIELADRWVRSPGEQPGGAQRC
jgi:hypothetical protein